MKLLDGARRAEHRAAVARRNLGSAQLRNRATYFAVREKLDPFRFRPSRYVDVHGFPPFDFFLHRSADIDRVSPTSDVSDRLWCFWTADNPLTFNRQGALQSMREANPALTVTLVTPSNLDQYIVEGSPLHMAYPYLSTIHKSDYLRAYFMHHYGGAYADIKRTSVGFLGAIRQVVTEPQLWLIGPTDPDLNLVGNLHGPIGRDTRRNHARIVGIAAMVALSYTPFTAEWVNEIERRLSYHAEDLKRNPAIDPFGLTGGYPVTWIGIGADVFQPLQLKYLDHVKIDNTLAPSFVDYR